MTPIPVGSLIFGDEFNGVAGSKPDTTKWVSRTGGSNGLAHYDGLTMIKMDGASNLVVTCEKVNGTWQSGFISSVPHGAISGKRYCEVRAKVAKGVGTWSAPLWEWPYPYGAGSTSGALENDVIEQLGKQPDEYHATVHNWNKGSNPQQGHAIMNGSSLSSGFHVYGAAVYPDHIDFYLDGNKKATTLGSTVGLKDITVLKVAEVIDLNIGGWGGTPTVTGPVSMLIDYVHVYSIV